MSLEKKLKSTQRSSLGQLGPGWMRTYTDVFQVENQVPSPLQPALKKELRFRTELAFFLSVRSKDLNMNFLPVSVFCKVSALVGRILQTGTVSKLSFWWPETHLSRTATIPVACVFVFLIHHTFTLPLSRTHTQTQTHTVIHLSSLPGESCAPLTHSAV